MAEPTVRVKITLNDRRVINAVDNATGKAAHNAARRAQRRARALIVARGRVHTGKMGVSIRIKKVHGGSPLRNAYRVGSDLKYTVYQELGVSSVHAGFGGMLRFKPKGSSTYVFTKSTKGFRGAHFMRDTVRTLTIRDFLD